MKKPHAEIRIGDTVFVRRERWRVVDIRMPNDCNLIVTLAGAGPSNFTLTRSVITPFDVIESTTRPRRLRLVSLARWRRACRALLREQAARASSASLYAAAEARIDLHPYQLEPALAVVSGRASRVLIADEVGLGKTIQSGLILSELRARGAADRVLIVAPAGLREQWAEELKARFGVDAVVMDMREGRRRAAQLPVGVNPWTTVPMAISSIDYIKRPEVLALVRATPWDAVIVDEAHDAAAASDRHDAAAAVCRVAAHIVLLTATPHSGDRAAFQSLCDLGALNGDPLLIFRRTRREVAIGAGRRIHRICVRPSTAERDMHDALAALSVAVRADGSENVDARLAVSVLHKRAFSSAHSLHESAARRLEVLEGVAEDREQQLLLPLDDTGDFDTADAAPLLPVPLLENPRRERELMADVLEAAAIAEEGERKMCVLRRLVRRLEARGERAIIFTEYRDTLLHVSRALNRPAAVIHGGLSIEARRSAVESFVRGTAPLLLATDAAGEGLNLHPACRVVINLELPWNPVRLEQRIGRVDRFGQARRVHVFHLIGRDTGEMEVAVRLGERVRRANADVGVRDPLGIVGLDAFEPEICSVRLLQEAAVEVVRLRERRDATWPVDRHDNDTVRGDVLVSSLRRRRRLRATLGMRCLAVLRASLDDAAGRTTAVHVSGVRLSTNPEARPLRRAAREIADALEGIESAGFDLGVDAWRAHSERAHRAFWMRRVERERAIQAGRRSSNQPLQSGLFDRRAERDAHAQTHDRLTFEAATADRLLAAERSVDLHTNGPRPVLLLLP